MQDLHPSTYAIRRFKLVSLLRFTFVVGVAVGLFPGLTGTLIIMKAISALRQLLESMKNVSQPIPVIGQRITFDYVELLNLSGTLQTLQFIDNNAWLIGSALLSALVLLVAAGLCVGTILAAIVYNTLAKRIGALEVVLEER